MSLLTAVIAMQKFFFAGQMALFHLIVESKGAIATQYILLYILKNALTVYYLFRVIYKW